MKTIRNSSIWLLLVFFHFSIFYFSCKSTTVKENANVKALLGNNFDAEIKKIYKHADKRQADSLIQYFVSENPEYRYHAAKVSVSVGGNVLKRFLISGLSDPCDSVRYYCAYSIGLQADSTYLSDLIAAFHKEANSENLNIILEAIGRGGSQKALTFINSIAIENQNPLRNVGLAYACYHLAANGFLEDVILKKNVEILKIGVPLEAAKIAATTLGRFSFTTVYQYIDTIINIYDKENDVTVKMNLAKVLAKIQKKEADEKTIEILKTAQDFRIIVYAINALPQQSYYKFKDIIFSLLDYKNPNVCVAAAQYFLNFGASSDATKYIAKATEIKNWRAAAIMYRAALKHNWRLSDNELVKSKYKNSNNSYEKAELILALGESEQNFEIVSAEVFRKTDTEISSAAMEAMVIMKEKSFKKANKQYDKKFAEVFKQAIMSNDVALISIAATALRVPEYKYNTYYTNTYFLKQALNTLNMPADIEAQIELLKTIEFFSGEAFRQSFDYNHEIEWENIEQLTNNQEVEIITNKGKIRINLFVFDAPATVASFVGLIKQGFFKQNVIHRAAPAFVIQSGCPRGDGWGSPGFSIRSELAVSHFNDAGLVGMASAGKDTESSQWFITQSPTIWLDGRYTIFGKVVEGIEVVNEIEIGDSIIDIVLK